MITLHLPIDVARAHLEQLLEQPLDSTNAIVIGQLKLALGLESAPPAFTDRDVDEAQALMRIRGPVEGV